jgi:cellulose biosynthesis protein BcsQ
MPQPAPVPFTVALVSVKGGVGKTTTAVNLAYLASLSGARVLLWDLDPQGATSHVLRVFDAGDRAGSRRPAAADVWATDYDRLDVVRNAVQPGEDARMADSVFAHAFTALAPWYDAVFFDCAAGIDDVTKHAVTIADVVLVPVLPSPLGVRTLEPLERFVARQADPPIVLPFFSMVDRRRAVHRETVERMQLERPQTLSAQIVNAAIVERMGARLEPVVRSAPDSGVAAGYRALWDELCDRAHVSRGARTRG